MERKELEKLKREELLELAKEKNVKGRSKMKKAELIKALVRLFSGRKKIKKQPAVKKRSVRKQPRRRLISRRKPPKVEPQKVTETAQLEREAVEATKYEAGKAAEGYQPQEVPTTGVMVEEKVEIPHKYGEDRLTLLVRDPWWIFAYWDITPQTWERGRNQVGAHVPLKEVMRVYDVTDIPELDVSQAHTFFDIELTPYADNWYINVGQPDRNFCAEIGFRTPEGKFYPLVRSNVVRTPRYGMSDKTDEEWMISEEEYWRMFGLSGGYGIGKGSLEMQEMFKKRFEELVSSGFPGSFFSWMHREEVPRGFWLVADAELIVYGATEPTAKVTVQDKPVKLRPDGSFSLRFALPDGVQEIPIQAISEDGKDSKRIKITVRRSTEEGE